MAASTSKKEVRVSEIYTFGEDGLQNLFEIRIVTLPAVFLGKVPVELAPSGRIQKLTMPGVNLESYDRHFKTNHIEVPNGKVNRSKEFSFELRVDRSFMFYTLLQAWVDFINSSKEKMALSPHQDCLGSITVKRLLHDMNPADSESNAGWIFQKVWVKSLSDVEFDWSSGEPIVCDVTCSYGWIDYLNEDYEQKPGISMGTPSSGGQPTSVLR